jgi:hypothetical protein
MLRGQKLLYLFSFKGKYEVVQNIEKWKYKLVREYCRSNYKYIKRLRERQVYCFGLGYVMAIIIYVIYAAGRTKHAYGFSKTIESDGNVSHSCGKESWC